MNIKYRHLLLSFFLYSYLPVYSQQTYLKEILGNTSYKFDGIVSFEDRSSILGPDPIIKLDSTGNILWAREFQNPDMSSIFSCFTRTKDGNVMMQQNNNLICVDTSGAILWSKKYTPDFQFANLTQHKEILLLATGFDTANAVNKILLLKTDSAGNPIWCKGYRSTIDMYHKSIIETADGGYLLAAEVMFPSWPYYSVITIKLDSIGNILHSYINSLGESHYGKLYKVTDNKYFLPGGGKFMCYDSTGNLLWNKMQTFDYWRGGIVNRDQHLVYTGIFWDTTLSFVYSNTTAEIDTLGDIVQCVRYGSGDTIGVYLLDTLNGGGYISVGGASSHVLLLKNDANYYSPCYDYHLNLFESIVSDSSTSILIYEGAEIVTSQVTAPITNPIFLLDSVICDETTNSIIEVKNSNAINVYPNPASSQFAISSLQFASGNLEIFNLLGEKIYSAVYLEPTTVNCEHFPRGIYFVRLSNSEKQFTQKLLIE